MGTIRGIIYIYIHRHIYIYRDYYRDPFPQPPTKHQATFSELGQLGYASASWDVDGWAHIFVPLVIILVGFIGILQLSRTSITTTELPY